MDKVIHKLLTIIAVSIPLLSVNSTYADTSVKYTTPLSSNVTDYNIDGDVTLDVNVAAVNALEITLSTSRILLNLVPGAVAPGYDSDTLSILVGTTNKTGYTLTMTPSYNNTTTTSLTRTETIDGATPTIETLSSTVSPTTFSSLSDTTTVNRWGYKLDTTNLDIDKTVYNPILSSMPLNSNTEPVSNDPTTISFAAKASNKLPAGTYRATLKFTAVANPTSKSINDLVYMQDFSTLTASEVEEVKENMEEETTYALKDSRDEQEYTIALLKDGNIWMTKNLNLAGGTILNSTTSNVAAAGYTLPTSSSITDFVGVYNSNYLSCDNISPCYSYYSWSVSVAGNPTNISTHSQPAPYDICPAGWRLPSALMDNLAESDTQRLAMAYGLPSDVSESDSDIYYAKLGPNTVSNFSLNGYFIPGGGLSGTGYEGSIWSSTLESSGGAAALLWIAQSRIKTNAGCPISYGRGLRCLAK